jgi:hypothetical protein
MSARPPRQKPPDLVTLPNRRDGNTAPIYRATRWGEPTPPLGFVRSESEVRFRPLTSLRTRYCPIGPCCMALPGGVVDGSGLVSDWPT